MPRPGPQRRPTINEAQRRWLEQLDAEGARLCDPEKLDPGFSFDNFKDLTQRSMVALMDTVIGPFMVVMAQGRVALHGRASGTMTPQRCIDQAYLRLALQELGWPEPDDKHGLREFYPQSTAAEVQTPSGPALVFASLQSGGYTSAGIKKICRRLGSTAMFRGFNVVILTPSATRGQQQAQRYLAYLRVIPVVPEISSGTRMPFRMPASTETQRQEPYFNERLAQEARQRNSPRCPPQSVAILCLPRTERMAHALAALQCDGVLTSSQLIRHYGLNVGDLRGQLLRRAVVRPCHGRDATEHNVQFFVRDTKLYRASAHHLAHRAGVAELRRQLGVEPDPAIWRVEARGRRRTEEPDAYWYSESGKIAIEYDTGSYSRQVIERKLSTFRDRGFEDTIWAVPTASRARYMGQFPDANVRQVEWWVETRS